MISALKDKPYLFELKGPVSNCQWTEDRAYYWSRTCVMILPNGKKSLAQVLSISREDIERDTYTEALLEACDLRYAKFLEEGH